jgi:HEPN domain-containing protein
MYVEMPMSVFEKFAKKYFEEALKDLERCRRALTFNDYPQAVFYAQQCVEKCTKALLEVKRRVVYNHGPELVTAFYESFKDELSKDLNIVIEALEYLMEYFTRSRYPFLLRGEVLGPEDIVTKDIAEKALLLAERVVEVTRNYLRERGVIQG